MARIFVINNTEEFAKQPAFAEYAGKVRGYLCFVVPAMDGLEQLVSDGCLEPVSFPPDNEYDRAAFIGDYTEFIAGLNGNHRNKLLWWCTDLSSKNRVACPLPDLVLEMVDIDRGMDLCKDRPMLIVGASLSSYGALLKMCAKIDRSLIWPNAKTAYAEKRTVDSHDALARLIWNALRLYRRGRDARTILGGWVERRISKKKDFHVIKTMSYSSCWDEQGTYADLFFGRLPQILQKDKNVLVWTSHRGAYQQFLERLPKGEGLFILPVEYFIGLWDVMRAFWRIVCFRVPVTGQERFKTIDVSELLRFELARTMNGVDIFQLLHYYATRRLLKTLKVRSFLFTFDNSPWERMCTMAIRQDSPSTRFMGYQHSVVPQAALNLFVSRHEQKIVPLPEMILTTGDYPKEILRFYSYGQLPVMKACALRYEYLLLAKTSLRPNPRGQVLLVLDEGKRLLKWSGMFWNSWKAMSVIGSGSAAIRPCLGSVWRQRSSFISA